MMIRGILAALAAFASLTAVAEAASVRATVESGVLVGSLEGKVRLFKAVPYAAAPVGALRWSPPAPAPAWRGDRPASAFGPLCPQPMNSDGSPNLGGATGATSEDCLFLNIWSPRTAHRAPVMVWLHGGGNTEGGGSIGAYDGAAFARDGVVLVTLNYRLGALGFFAHPALTKAAKPGDALVAYGVMDQIAALQWVQRNIAAFGGDPANVTVFGESAGGADTLVLMASPLARGLFAKAIVESGLGWAPPKTLARAEAQGVAMAIKAGAPQDATVEQLRAISLEALSQVDERQDFGAAIDGRLLTESVSQAFARHHAARTPLIIGSNSYEASLMASLKLSSSMVLGMAPPSMKGAYADIPEDEDRAAAIFTDNFMGAPARWIAANASGPAYLYRFEYVPTALRGKVPGAGHDLEIPFVFDSWSSLGALGVAGKPSAEDTSVTSLMHACWVLFAKTSSPGCANWPAYSSDADMTMVFSDASVARSNVRRRQYEAQEAVMLPILQLGN